MKIFDVRARLGGHAPRQRNARRVRDDGTVVDASARGYAVHAHSSREGTRVARTRARAGFFLVLGFGVVFGFGVALGFGVAPFSFSFGVAAARSSPSSSSFVSFESKRSGSGFGSSVAPTNTTSLPAK